MRGWARRCSGATVLAMGCYPSMGVYNERCTALWIYCVLKIKIWWIMSGHYWIQTKFEPCCIQMGRVKKEMRFTLSGSDQRRSQRSPWSGTSVGRIIRRICSIDWRSGLNPPWQQKIFSSTMAAMGRQLKQSVKVFHNLMLKRRLPVWKISYLNNRNSREAKKY